MDQGSRHRRPTFGQRWRGYGDRPPVARWTARVSYVVGVAVAVAVLAVAVVVAARLLWSAVAWALFKA